jgi:hypothetical protein
MIRVVLKAIEGATKLDPNRVDQKVLFKNVSGFILKFIDKKFKKKVLKPEDIHLDIIPFNSYGYPCRFDETNL